ncbi:hypothetical protein [Nannocystis bainbridge]|uniref:Uncharacterized protein n=1 Tax=Nannocystis bainbridge TaxID=2995303 RepID=A0ABT5ED95_9BACT|nr:hypothetical protein [Nannocystis bainbridge]MDC0722883.1 hypothetical protein [Nannocystis bainbridge]
MLVSDARLFAALDAPQALAQWRELPPGWRAAGDTTRELDRRAGQ